MNTFDNMKKIIPQGKKTDEEILTMCDIFLMNNRITDVQYTELVGLINAE